LTGEPAPARRALPIWLTGLGFLPLGAAGSITLITVPQLLSGAHVPEQQIATVTSIALMPGFITFALAPLLDWRFRRRTYAILFMLISAACQFGALLSIGNRRCSPRCCSPPASRLASASRRWAAGSAT